MELRPPSQHVSARARMMWATEGLVSAVVVVIVTVVTGVVQGGLSTWWTAAAVALIAACLLVGVLLVPIVRYRVHRWEVTNDAVYTQRGLMSVEQRIAPISRVQTVDTERGVLARLFGLSTVTVTTASAKGALRIEGLGSRLAEDLVQQLTARTAAESGDAT